MKGFFGHIETDTLENNNFRKVLFTGAHSQLVLMMLKPGEEIGMETHADHDQFFRFESGTGRALIDDQVYNVADGDAVIVPGGAVHNVINTSESKMLKLYTIYSPAEHPDGTVFATKEEAMAGEHH